VRLASRSTRANPSTKTIEGEGDQQVKIDPQSNLLGTQSSTSVGAADSAANARSLKIANDRSGQGSDQASLSADAVRLSSLRTKLNGVPEIRQDRVATVSAALRNGTYSVSNKQIAQSLLRDFQTGTSGK
jgi:flagellar biosynthesis anti-sigma factor FlgM